MTEPDDDYIRIRQRVGAHGLILRGGFYPQADDGVPALADARPAVAADGWRSGRFVGHAGCCLSAKAGLRPRVEGTGRAALDRRVA